MATPAATVLVTGFEPFDGDSLNSSWEVARRLNDQKLTVPRGRGPARRTAHIVARRLPCEFDRSRAALSRLVKSLDPVLIIALGQANLRNEVSVERVAINISDARIADNAGARPIDTPVIEAAPVGYFSQLPIKAIVEGLRKAGIPASVSQTAGTYVCNHVFFGLMHLLAQSYPDKRGGFIHLPPLPQQAARLPGTPSLALDTMVQAVQLAVTVSLSRSRDLRASDGQVS